MILYFLGIFFFILLLGFSISYVFKKNETVKGNVRTIIIIGSGGHTSEILKLIRNLANHYQPRLYVMADSDKTSENKIHNLQATCSCDYKIVKIPRSRAVGQSYITSIFSTLSSALNIFRPVYVFQPNLVLCNGPGTCVPVCIITFLFSKILRWKTKIVFIESICRVQSLSLTGKILKYFADSIIVQWPELHNKFPFTIYLGRLL